MPTRTQKIISLRKQGLTRPQIAARLGVTENLLGSYLHWLLRKGVIAPIPPGETRRRRWEGRSKVDVDEARRLRLLGQSYEEIARRYGVSGATVARVVGSTVRVTPIQRQLIILHLQGLTFKAIAAQVNKPLGTVAVMLARLVKRGLLPKRASFLRSDS